MYLSELNIVGFKSFAKKTRIVFDTGLTAIVGPNGCGKSNIMDAIRWVMGEQKSTVLRSDRMESVIFNGSASAKPVGMAEVSLKIENTRNVLPIEYTDVVLSRRLFRSGESQYLINGNPCRLKDVLDLFMDTGMAAHAYSVIELSQVEQILNGKPDERRRIFEEAAGITKYKLRRKATFRKLEATEKDLVRIEDIMSEVEKAVRSLRRQVSKAQRYQKITAELKELEINVATQDFSRAREELQPLESKLNSSRAERAAFSAELATKEADYEATRNELLQLDQQITAEQEKLSSISNEIQKLEERILVNNERCRSLNEARVRFIKDKDTSDQRLKDLSKELNDVQEKAKSANSSLQQKQTEYQTVFQQFESLRSHYDEERNRVRQDETEIIHITEELSQKQSEGTRLRATEENLSQRLGQLEEEENSDKNKRDNLQHNLTKAKEAERNLTRTLEHNRMRYEELTKKSEEARRALAGLQKADLEDNKRMEVLENQAELVKRLLENYEDYPAGVKFLATLDSAEFSSIGAVANILRIDPQHRLAISAALAEAATYLVVDNSSLALQGIGLLKHDRKGVVSFLPLQELSINKTNRPQVQDLGVVGWADELVHCDNRFRALSETLLSCYLVVQDLETANRLFKNLRSYQVNIVTLAGEMLGHWGIIRGGTRGKRHVDFIGRQEELAELQRQIETIHTGCDNRRATMTRRSEEAHHTKLESESLAEANQKMEEQLSAKRVELGRLVYEEQTLLEAQQKRSEERQQLLERVTQLGENLQTQNHNTLDLQKKREYLSASVKNLNNSLKKVEQELNISTARVQENQIEVAKLQSEHEALIREVQSFQNQIELTKQSIESRELEMSAAAREIEELGEANAANKKQQKELEINRSSIQQGLDKLKEKQYAINVRTDEQEKKIRVVRAQNEEVSETAHQVELRVSELKLRMENLRSRILDEFEHTLMSEPRSEDFNRDEATAQIESLREKLKNIGPVNLLALKEYEQEKERFDFLQTQREDLIKARRNLTDTINIINATARDKFLETFEQIQKNFSIVFKTFFDGGRANLILREGNDPLEAEIDIFATPGGKRLSTLQLMSGGEKSLTAISLLFAIYLVKPSPFCIFDEVDAPLDDRNIMRFTKALQEFSTNTQFIIVTHNKLTMRAADQLYGITMEEDGISKIVSVKFDKEEMRPQPVVSHE